MRSSDEIVGKTCPYCMTPIKPNAAAVVCSACGMPHHAECWQENRRCTTFGCNGSPLTADGMTPQAVGAMPLASPHRQVSAQPAGGRPPVSPADGRPGWAIDPEPVVVTLEPEDPAKTYRRLQRWNWGAFVLAPFWVLGMRLWAWVVPSLIPFLGILVALYLGARGNELAWKSRRWRGVEEFDQVQEAWTQFGIMIFLASLVALLLTLGSRAGG